MDSITGLYGDATQLLATLYEVRSLWATKAMIS